jgi:hypothetical protein
MNNKNNKSRIESKIIKPKISIIELFQTYDYKPSINSHSEFVKNVLLEKPFETYISFRNRLSVYGHNAEFPEFEGVIGYLIKEIFQNSAIFNFYQNDNNIIIFNQLINKLIGININNRFNYPYQQTIYCMESLLELLDNYYRINYKENYPEYYHIFRFRSYLSSFFEKEYGFPDSIIFPTIFNFGATHLIKIRPVPIYIIGIINEPIYVDNYIHTPLDFWGHDIGHAALQLHETMRYFDVTYKHSKYNDEKTFFSIKKIYDLYKDMDDFTKSIILPNIIIRTDDSEEIKKIKQMAKMIIFEIVHEYSYVITKDSIIKYINSHNGNFASEYYYINNDKISTKYIKSKLLPIKNIVFDKLNKNFYNKKNNRKKYIVPVNFRNIESVSTGIKYILDFLN